MAIVVAEAADANAIRDSWGRSAGLSLAATIADAEREPATHESRLDGLDVLVPCRADVPEDVAAARRLHARGGPPIAVGVRAVTLPNYREGVPLVEALAAWCPRGLGEAVEGNPDDPTPVSTYLLLLGLEDQIQPNETKDRNSEAIVGFVGVSEGDSPKFEGDPIPLAVELAEVPDFAPELLPEVFRDWLVDHSERCCLPLDYSAASALVALGSLVSRKLAVRPKCRDDWLAVSNFWGAAMGPPGLLKSEATSEGQRFLRRLEARAAARHIEALADHETTTLIAAAEAKAAKDALEKAAKKGASREELEGLAQRSRQAALLDPPSPVRYVAGDGTIEKLSEILRENPGLLSARDELTGLLRTMDRQGHENDRAFYLEAWNGDGPYFVDRIQRGSYVVPRLCLSIFGTVQPGPLARYIREAAAGGCGNDGLLQRFQLLVFPDPPARFTNVDRYPDSEAKAKAREVFDALDALDPLAVGIPFDEAKKLHYLGFDDDAQPFFDEWRVELEERLRSGELSAILQSHLGKYRSLMPSLSLVLHLVDSAISGEIRPVSIAAAERAAAWCDYLEAHARRIYAAAFDGDVEPAERLAERITKSRINEFTFRQIAQKGWKGLDSVEDVRRAVGILADRNWVRVVETQPASGRGGRPSEKVWVHPQVLGGEP